MGTRADFYVGRGESAEWLGSIAWDGYPEGMTGNLLQSTDETMYRAEVAAFFARRDDVTLPAAGWPWPWDDSQTTDFAYAFDGGKVWASCFGCEWYDPLVEVDEEESEARARKEATFPNMAARKNVALGSKRSGIIVIG